MAVSADEAARSSLEKLVSTFASAWNAHDAHAFAAVFAEDVDFTNVFGLVSDGRAGVERSHAAIFRTMFKDSVLTVQAPRVRFLRSDIAVVDVHWAMTGGRDPAGNAIPERHGLFNAIATAEPDGWLFKLFHNQDLPRPPRASETGGGIVIASISCRKSPGQRSWARRSRSGKLGCPIFVR